MSVIFDSLESYALSVPLLTSAGLTLLPLGASSGVRDANAKTTLLDDLERLLLSLLSYSGRSLTRRFLASRIFLYRFFRHRGVPGEEAAACSVWRPKALCKESVNRFQIYRIVQPATVYHKAYRDEDPVSPTPLRSGTTRGSRHNMTT